MHRKWLRCGSMHTLQLPHPGLSRPAPLHCCRGAKRTWPSSPPCAPSAATGALALWPTSGASTWASPAPGGHAGLWLTVLPAAVLLGPTRCYMVRIGRLCMHGVHVYTMATSPSCWPTYASSCLSLALSPQGHPDCGGPCGVAADQPALVGPGVPRPQAGLHVQGRCVPPGSCRDWGAWRRLRVRGPNVAIWVLSKWGFPCSRHVATQPAS